MSRQLDYLDMQIEAAKAGDAPAVRFIRSLVAEVAKVAPTDTVVQIAELLVAIGALEE